MKFCNRTALTALIAVAVQGYGAEPHRGATAVPRVTKQSAAGPSGRVATEKSTPHGYDNGVNRLHEGLLKVTDDQGKPAVHGWSDREFRGEKFEDVQLEIVWTSPSQFSWNYCIPELHGGRDVYETEYPSTPLFLERKLGAKTSLGVSIPDTPYSFYIINGRVSSYFYDVNKSVIWRLNSVDLEKTSRQMRSISASSKKIVFSAGGGDMAEFLVVDFSDRENSPKVKYWIRYDGP